MRNTSRNNRAFSIIEALLVLAVMAAIGGVVMIAVSKTTQVAQTTKLDQDVAVLNSAVRMFKANGGKIANSWKVAKVLDELKTKADIATGTRIAGLRGTMLDPRIEAIDETFEEAGSGEPKALWDSVNHRFYVSKAPVRGVKRFAMNTAKAETGAESRARTVNLALSGGDGWVWNFTDNPSNTRNAPRSPDGSLAPNGNGSGNGSGNPLPPGGPLQLNPPVGTGGTYDLVQFPITFSLENQNPSGSSVIMVSTDGVNWAEYSNAILAQAATTKIYSFADSIDDSQWIDSDIMTATIDFNKVPLQIGLAFDKSSYHYGDLGGAFIGGGTPGSGANRGLITLVNPGMVPSALMNSDNFRVQYTYDGSSPLGGNATSGVPFSGTWATQPVPVGHGLWGQSGSTITVSAVAKSLNDTYIDSSPVHTRTLAIERIQLREAVATVYGGRVALSLVTQYHDMPVGARVVFNVNGVDPGNVNGEPTSGVLYSGGQISLEEDQILVARVYAPSGYNNWFLTSAPVTIHGDTLGGGGEEEESEDPTLVTNNGLVCGQLEVDTSSFLAEFGFGTTDGHVHRYDDKFQTTSVDFFNVLDSALHNISRDITDPNTRFKLIIANPDLSIGGRIVINTPAAGASSSFVGVRSYASTELEDLPVFSLGGVAGTTRLSDLQISFDQNVAPAGGIIPTTTEAVRKNIPGRNGEWRNGALTIQAVRVNADGSPAFTTDVALSAGGVQGVARSGLLWEATLFLNASTSYDQNLIWNPGQPSAVCDNPEDCCGGGGGDPGDEWLISGFAGGLFSHPTGDANINTNLIGSQTSSYFQWGTRYSSSTTANHADFEGSIFDGVGVGDRFLLGSMEYRNGTTYLGTNATAVDFSIDIAFMGGAVTKTFDYSFGLFSTPNNTGSAYGDADYFRLTDIQSSATVSIFGVDYRLDLAFGQTSNNGFSTIDEFHIFENSTGYGELWGTIVRF